MVNVMVERATSDMLIGPDWARNAEICDICNYDPMQAKDIVKSIKKRIRRRNAKVQLLALTLLETIVKNCGDIVHMHVAQKELPHQMVRIVKKKKPDFHVREKILILIDTWQEAFGGPRARYPQYFVAYQDLLRLGVVFPQRSESSAPAFENPQNNRNPESGPGPAESSAEAEFPTLSLTEIQNARGIMDVLADMLNAIDPANNEGIKQDVVVDLVEQCRTYKHRVVHLVNSTTDESLLNEGLALNDDLQRLLAKHESISSGAAPIQSEKSNLKTDHQPLVNIDAPLIDTGDDQHSNKGSNGQLTTTTTTKADQSIDLLSWDGFNSPTEKNSLALVPAGEIQPGSGSQHNPLDLVDMFTQSDDNLNNAHQSSNSTGQESSNLSPPTNFQPPQDSNPNAPEFEQPVYGSPSTSSLPPPPWEAQLDDHDHEQAIISQPQPISSSDLAVQNNSQLATGPHQPDGMYPQPMQSGYMYTQAQQMYGNQMGGYGYGPTYGYGQSQPLNGQFLEQNLSGLSVSDNSMIKSSSYPVSYVPSGKPSKPEDKLFGDLVDMSKFKPAADRSAPGRTGSM
ncbi:ENTH/VHS/GAT family protein [Striga hermonthica]|uniref:ENTH/VHS/GAT family protein n=1 Tax=Striga hermonthica TaxID=68872 RepID=A0A9N7NWK8_STRHE|nr:ENTH/VHS/GAT family protein [Striga hermonthica]